MKEAEFGDSVGEQRTTGTPCLRPTVDTLLEEEPVEDELAATVEKL